MKIKHIFSTIIMTIFVTALSGCGVQSEADNNGTEPAENQKTEQEVSQEDIQEQTATQSEEITGDLATDVGNGVLYSTEDGKISDKDGNALSEYDYITISDNGSLSDSEGILEGYFVGAGGKINLDIPGESEETADVADTMDSSADTTGEQKIKNAKAKDDNDLTGTYEDKESGAILSLIVEGDKAAYSLSTGKEGDTPQVEQNCTIDSNSISGKFYYIMKNMDGTLGITSGVGAPWGNFEKTDNSAEINLAYDLAIEEQQRQEEYASMSPLEKMRSRANESNCNNEIEEGIEHNGENLNNIGDDGDYYDEVVLGSWFNEDGSPKAMFPPVTLSRALGNIDGFSQLELFDFINGEEISIGDVKRRGTDRHWYAIVLMDIQKQEDEYGDIYFEGRDPISDEYVVVKGNFSSVLNGDDLLVFGTSMGTASDDTLNIQGAYIQNVTSRLGSVF